MCRYVGEYKESINSLCRELQSQHLMVISIRLQDSRTLFPSLLCVGALVQVKACTATSDTVCACKEGLMCGDAHCSFCVKKCGKGEEPTEKRQ